MADSKDCGKGDAHAPHPWVDDEDGKTYQCPGMRVWKMPRL